MMAAAGDPAIWAQMIQAAIEDEPRILTESGLPKFGKPQIAVGYRGRLAKLVGAVITCLKFAAYPAWLSHSPFFVRARA